MPADFSQYVDLTVYDKEPGDMYLEAIDMARLTMPEFTLRAGTVEDAIFQAMAWIGWVNATSLNRVPDRLMAGILSMMGVTLQLESPAQMWVTVTANSYEGATIPVGTLFGYTTIFEDEVNEYVFLTVEPLEISADEDPEPGDPFPSGVVACECLRSGAMPSISPGTSLSILSPSTSIISAEAFEDSETNRVFQNGLNDESSAEFLSRAVSYLSSLSSSFVTAKQVDAGVANTYSGLVGRVRTYDLTDGDLSTGNIATPKTTNIVSISRAVSPDIATLTLAEGHQFQLGDKIVVSGLINTSFNGTFTITSVVGNAITYPNTGTVLTTTSVSTGTVEKGLESVGKITVFVYGNGDFVSEANLTDILSYVSGKSIPGLIVSARNFEIMPLEIEATIVLDSNYDQQVLEQTIENSIIEYLSPVSYPTSEDTLRANQVIALISSIPGVRYVSSLSLLPGSGNWLPQVGENLEPANKGWTPRVTPDDLTISYTVA
jgi:hypothetical protein